MSPLGRIEFGAGEYIEVNAELTSDNQHLAVGKQRGRVIHAGVIHRAGYGPCVTGEVVEKAAGGSYMAAPAIVAPCSSDHDLAGAEECRRVASANQGYLRIAACVSPGAHGWAGEFSWSPHY